MEWNEKLQEIVDYIEGHLQRGDEPADMEVISRMAGCSYGFFQKVFSYMNGMSLAEYIRFRKMTLAGYDLKSSGIKVVDLSFKYGYDSPTSFTKAFQQFHGVSPKEGRNKDIELKVFPKIQIDAGQKYAWRVEEKRELRLIGQSIQISRKENQHFRKIPEFWSRCQRDGTFSKLVAMDGGEPEGMFGLFRECEGAEDDMIYSLMVLSEVELPEGFDECIIPDAAWAVFDCRGSVPDAIQKGWRYLEEEWIFEYPFAHAKCPELEWYSSGNSYDKDYLSQIWIPIIEK